MPGHNLHSDYDPSVSGQTGFEYRFVPRWALETVLGFDNFDGEGTKSDLLIGRLAANPKFYAWLGGAVQVGLFAGPELSFVEGDGVNFGFDAGAMVEYRINKEWSVELQGAFHQHVTDNYKSYGTSAVQLRYRF